MQPLDDRIVPAAISIANATPYTQNFDSLSSSGANQPWANDTTIAGWSLFNKSFAAISAYNADTGGSSTGSFYSFGVAGTNPLTERALGGTASGGAYFGSPASGTVAGWITVALQNDTGAVVNDVNITFDGEQWRNGGNATKQSMVMEYGFGATFTGVTTWTAAGAAFNWQSPIASTTAAALDGNAAANRVGGVGGPLSGVAWNSGDVMWLRWIENNDTGNDHGLAIDNFSFSAVLASGTSTSTSITSISPLAATLGDNVTFQADVAALTGTDTPTGTVEFREGSTVLASGAVTGTGATGTVSVTTNAISAGTYTAITAYYLPTGTFNGSTSAVFGNTLTVSANSTTLNLSSDQTNPTVGTSITFTATASSTGGTPTGAVDFYANGLKLNPTPVTVNGSGVATFTVDTNAVQATDKLTPGINHIQASFTGTGSFLNSTVEIGQKVKPNAFSAGNVLVFRVGDGINTLTNAGNRFYIDEYVNAAAQTSPLQSILMPTIAVGNNKPVLASGSQSTEGQLVISPDGAYVYFTAYNAPPTNTLNLTVTSATTIPRVIGRMNLGTGEIETSMALTDLASATSVRGIAVTASGDLYASGGGNGTTFNQGDLRYLGAYNAAATTSTSLGNTAVAWTGLHVAGVPEQLYGATLSNSPPPPTPPGTNPKLGTIGTGLPTSGTPAVTTLPGIPLTFGTVPKNPVDFYFADLDPAVDAGGGLDTLYISENGLNFSNGTITKWCWDPVNLTWTTMFTINPPGTTTGLNNTFFWMSGVTAGGTVTLFATCGQGGSSNTGGGTLWSTTDSGGYTLTPSPVGPPLVELAQVDVISKRNYRGAARLPGASTAPTVSSIAVNQGYGSGFAAQRSRIINVVVNFASPVDASQFQAAGAVTLTRTQSYLPGTPVIDTSSGLIVSPVSGSTSSITLTFQNTSNPGVIDNASLGDGYWRLAIAAAGYQSPLNDISLRRLFGDFDANGTVDGAVDFPAFGADFNGTYISPPSSPFDFNNDGLVDGAVDFPAFGANFNLSL